MTISKPERGAREWDTQVNLLFDRVNEFDAVDPTSLATDAELTAAVAAHAADTTDVHGIADTSVLATDAEVTAAVAAHVAASDPHADRAYAAAQDAAHVAAGDPHAQYLTEAGAASTYQPLDSDLTAIAALSPSNDDVVQRKAGAWTSRTIAQLAADLTATDVQPKDADLTTIAGLTATTDSFIQAKSSAWAARTIAQVKTDLGMDDPLSLGAAFSYDPGYTDPTGRAMDAVNRAVYRRCVGAGTFSSVKVRVATQSGNICVAVYADTIVGGVHQPGARVATTGSVACPATGAASALALDASVTVTHGSHWFACAADNTTATFIMPVTFPISDGMADGIIYSQDSAFPLPSSAASLTACLRRIPLIRGV